MPLRARKPGTIPKEVIEALSRKIDPDKLSTRSIPKLRGESVEHIEEVEKLLDRDSDLARLIAHNRVAHLVEGSVTPESIRQTNEEIEKDIRVFEELTSTK